jgi:hypothetical protein
VAELVATAVSVVVAFADARALDVLAPVGASTCRVAPDELMFVAEPAAAGRLVRDAGAVTAGDADAVVVDASDGWACWTIAGEGATEAFARISELHPPRNGFVCGDVAHVPVRAMVEGGALHLFVPSMWRDYLREQILSRCADVSEAGATTWGAFA